MASLKKADIVSRLGFPLETLEFRGQCYDLGPGQYKICALTHRPARFLFTLKRIDGLRGKATIGPASFPLLKRHAPDIYLQLERGRLWLQLMVEAEARALQQASLTKRLTTTQKSLAKLRQDARQSIALWRAEHRRGELPVPLQGLRLLLKETTPKFTDHDSAMLWLEQKIQEYEAILLSKDMRTIETSFIPEPVAPVILAGEAPKKASERRFKPVPEIEF